MRLHFKLKIPVNIISDSAELTLTICTIMGTMKKRLTNIKKTCRVGLEPPARCLRMMAACIYELLLINSGFCRLVKINLVFFKDTAFISSKSRFDRCWHSWVMSIPKMQTDGQTAFQLYIVDYQLVLMLNESLLYMICTENIKFTPTVAFIISSVYLRTCDL